jgi:hypothetical protein
MITEFRAGEPLRISAGFDLAAEKPHDGRIDSDGMKASFLLSASRARTVGEVAPSGTTIFETRSSGRE